MIERISKLAELRRKWVEVTRQNGFREGISDLLAHQYAEKTHFLFELLQNAEDARAEKVKFDISKDGVVFSHDGKRLFSADDVESITSIGQSNKRSDYTQIGKHGIGFKAVFAYTHTPRIHSGCFHFDLVDVVVPELLDDAKKPADLKTGETRIILPFDSESIPEERRFRPLVSAQRARDDIAKAVRQLNLRTLLFLRNITEIHWSLPDGTTGLYLRNTLPVPDVPHARYVEVAEDSRMETWLVYEKVTSVIDNGTQIPATVEVAFLVEKDTIRKAERTELSVFFPTGKTTGLGFLIQGPFKTTKARDNIKTDDPANQKLLEKTAALAANGLEMSRDLGLLRAASYEALPLTEPEDPFFIPVFDAIRGALSEKPLLPTLDGAYVTARQAKLARGTGLSSLLPTEQLRTLCQAEDDVHWLSADITNDRMPELYRYLRDLLEVEEIDPNKFARMITSAFLQEQDDEWFAAFYGFLLNQEALWRAPKEYRAAGPLWSKSILRLEDGSLVSPYDDRGLPNAYLPLERPTKSPTVRTAITDHKTARDFLEKLGLRKPDQVTEVVIHILPKYRYDEVEVTDEDYLEDLEAIFAALETDSKQAREQLVEEAQETPFIWAANAATGEESFLCPNEVYLRNPETELFFDGNPDFNLADLVFSEKYEEGCLALGMTNKVRVFARKSDWSGSIRIRSQHGWHVRGLNGFDPDASIDGLEYALSNPNENRSQFIWNNLLIPNAALLSGIVESATRQDFSNGYSKSKFSRIGELASSKAWVLGIDGQFHCPSKIAQSMMHAGYERHEGLIERLNMLSDSEGQDRDTLNEVAEEIGIPTERLGEIVSVYRDDPESFMESIKLLRERKKAAVSFPSRPVQNPDRREERIGQQYEDATEKTYEKRERSVRTTRTLADPDGMLRSYYTNDDAQMVCQVCKDEMPFRKRDGEYYFERVEVLSPEYLAKEHDAQYLALCPLCSAMYKEFVRRDDDAMQRIHDQIQAAVEPEIELALGELETTLRFVESHFCDIKAILACQD